MAEFMKPYGGQTYSLMRIIVGALFFCHGLSKLFGLPVAPPPRAPPFILYVSGTLEFVCGALVALGLLTRWAAFITSGLMAFAYWLAHGTKSFFPMVNQGELAVLYCFVFLFIAAHGAGIWSVDTTRK